MQLIRVGNFQIFNKDLVEKLANVKITCMENEIKISAIEVQKELMKSKVMTKFSHYTSGNMYYTVEVLGGTYQFPISTIDVGTLKEIAKEEVKDLDGYQNLFTVQHLYLNSDIENSKDELREPNELELIRLSEDLGTTTFSSEMKGSELNRWIKKAISNNEFIKIG